MSSTSGPLSSSSKSISATTSSISSAYGQQAPQGGFDTGSQRRPGGSGSFGAGSATRYSPSPRNHQPQKKQNKAQRRAKLADEDAIAESAAMKSINSRKGQTSITHLMQFALPPRPYFQPQSHHQNNRYQRKNPTWGLGSGYHAIDKARYVHANYRFIVRPNRDYSAQVSDSDVHLQWDCILQVLASAQTQAASCPICLSDPVAPRMAKCGHIFCLPCLIRYMHSTDDTNPIPEKRARWKKCPICEDSIYISEVRPVRWFIGQEASMLREGGDVLLKLVAREPGTTLALPRDAAEMLSQQEDIPWYHVAEVIDYARFMKGGEDYMTEQYTVEIQELEEQEKNDGLIFGEDATWTRKAVASITDAMDKIKGIGNPPDAASQPERPHRSPIFFESPNENAPQAYTFQRTTRAGQSLPSTSPALTTQTAVAGQSDQTHSEDVACEGSQVITKVEQLNLSGPESSQQKLNSRSRQLQPTRSGHHPQVDTFFFYQALPNFYLSPLDIRILKSAYGSFSSFPSTILPRVEHISTGHVIDDDLRRRAKYMAHLPYGCEVNFLECDWTGSVSSKILEQFSAEIARRRQKNNEKARREEKERQIAEQKEKDQMWAAARRKRPSISDKPHFSEADFAPLAQLDNQDGQSTSVEDSHLSSSPPWSTSRIHSSSFATLASPGTSPEAPRTVWGTAAVRSNSPPPPEPEPQRPVDDGWLQGWEEDLLDDGDAVAMVEASMAEEKAGAGSRLPSLGNSGGKKKKGKKITLMSTNARRGA
ncbi:MAG: hypothetical protein Q9227_004543 [Pyrenula ochraceoflavens]